VDRDKPKPLNEIVGRHMPARKCRYYIGPFSHVDGNRSPRVLIFPYEWAGDAGKKTRAQTPNSFENLTSAAVRIRPRIRGARWIQVVVSK
jgi:hypothetical protein